MAALKALGWLVYPLAILFGLRLAEPRAVALALAAGLLLRHARAAARLLAGFSRAELIVAAGLLLLALTAAATNSEALLRLYPAAVNLGLLALFGLSIAHPPSMAERFARAGGLDAPPGAARYLRRVTLAWCVFFAANGAAALHTALFAGREAWALYNGFIAYLLMGALFGGEWLLRRFFLRR
ncbi:MAG: hypothetical protein LBS70_09140 [Candidatus Accumulibacter sp.]|jgi:uncharacterized membrane protein|nr:hypothetical protein [Accumulibacter sp.]